MNVTDSHPQQLLAWYVNETLPPDEMADLDKHLQQCEHCRSEVALLKRLRDQVRQEQISGPGELGFSRLQRSIKQERKTNIITSLWRQPALAAAAVIILVQSALLINLWPEAEPMAPLGVQYEGPVLQIIFTPDSTVSDIQKLLERVQGSIVDGPSAVGVYRVRLGLDSADEKTIEKIVAQLKREQEVTHVARE